MNFTQSDAIEEFELGLPMIPNEYKKVEPDYEVFGNKYVGLVITGDNPGEINNIATEISKAKVKGYLAVAASRTRYDVER